jgi:hypothetical protein
MPTISQLPPSGASTVSTPNPLDQFPFWSVSQLQTLKASLATMLGTNLSSLAAIVQGAAGNVQTDGAGNFSVATSSRVVLNWASAMLISGAAGKVFDVTLAGKTAFSFGNLQDGETYKIILVQDGIGNRIVTWPAAAKWVGGIVPVLSTAPGAIDDVSFLNRGGTLLGTFAKGFN